MQYLEICLLTTKALGSFNFLFFRVLLLPQQNEIQLVSRFFLSSKPFGPGNWIQSKLDFLKVVRLVFWSGVVGRSLARAPRSYDRASRSQSRYALKSSTCEQV